MKSIKILAASLSLVAILAGCTREPIPVGIDSKHPGVTEVAVADAPYNGKSATIAWDGAQAVAAGAKSFTVEFVLSSKDSLEADKPNNYDATVSGVVPVEASETSYSKKISGQVKGAIYYVRVRANYEKSRYSEWAYLMNPETGDRARFKLGRGIISEGIEDPYLYKITPTSTGLIVKWDLIPGVTAYEIQYRKTSEDSWTTVVCGADEKNYKITGLPSETEYAVRAKSYIADEGSDYCEEQIVTTRQPGSFPMAIKNAEELVAWLEAGIVEVEASQTFTLENDIDLSDASFVAMDEPLMGTFDGQGHTISGVSGNLFFQNDGTIKNLNVAGSVKIDTDSPSFGAFVITNNGTITNCSSKVDVEYTTKENCDILIGGFCCDNNGTLDHVTNAGNVTVTHNGDLLSDYYDRTICIGGIASSSNSVLTECTNTGNVSYVSSAPVLGPAVAGIAGFIGGKAEKCNNKGAVTLQFPYSKADAGKGYLPQLEGKTFSASTYYGTPAAAGIAAYSYSATPSEALLDECINDGAVNFTATSIDKYTTTVQRIQAAGIIANPWGLIRNCTNNGALSFAANTTSGSASGGTFLLCCGGIAGGSWFEASQDVTNYEGCVNNGDIDFIKYDKVGSSNSTCGGIVGWPGVEGSRSNATKNCTNNGAVSFKGTGKARVGGIHGGSGAMNGCINNGEVHCYSGDPNSAIGGLAGFSSNGLTIQNCQSRGPVISDIEMAYGVAGGIGNLGNAANSGKLTNCVIATKVVNAAADNSKTGMIIGYFNGTSASTPLGASGAIKVSGKIKTGSTTTALTSGNFTSFLVGTANASDNHKVNAVFDSTPYVDPDEGSDEPENPVISAPKNVVIAVLYNSVKVSWDAVDGAEWYVVDYKKAGTEEWVSAPKVETNECVLEGLEHGTSYSFRIRAFATTGSGYSDVTSGETLPAVNLTAPVVTPATPEPASCVINWAAIEGATSYAVEYKEASAETWTATAGSETNSIELKSLKPSTLYDVRVKALGAGGNEGEWGAAQFTTDKVSYSYPLSIANGAEFAEWINTAAAVCAAGDVITLTGDIDLAGKTLESVATFAGTLDGNGKTIKNLTLAGAPIFKKNNGTIKNLIIDASCTVTAAEGNFAIIAAENAGSVENCVNNANITLGDYSTVTYLGAIVGSNTGKVVDCTNNGNITITPTTTASNSFFAGVVGQFSGTKGVASVSGCKNTGKILYNPTTTPKNPNVAGVVGGTTPNMTGTGTAAERKAKAPNVGLVTGCTNTGDVTATWSTNNTGSYTNIGGVVAFIEGDVENCENTGAVKLATKIDVTASNTRPSVGGVAGYVMYSAKGLTNRGTVTVDGCYAAGGDGKAGAGSMMQPCFGGVIGGIGYAYLEVQPDESMEGCKNYGTLEFKAVQKLNGGTKSNTGAVAGYCAAHTVKDCHNYEAATLSSAHNVVYAGGVIGLGYPVEMSSCTNEGALTFDGRSSNLNSAAGITKPFSFQAYCGGIIGFIAAGAAVKDCENKAELTFKDYTTETALNYLGGINGSYSGHFTMTNCKNTAAITSTATCALAMGGVSGAFNGVMDGCSNSAKLDCATNKAPTGKQTEVGGLVGYANMIAKNCSNTGDITTAVAGSYAGGLFGAVGLGGAKSPYADKVRQVESCTADCAITGPATIGSIVGHFRNANAGETLYYKDMTIGSSLNSAPVCGDLNGNTITEGSAPIQ